MADQKGTHVTKFDALPATRVNARVHGAYVRAIVDTFKLEDTADDDIAYVAKMPIDAIVHSIKFGCDDLGSAGVVDIGVYKKNADGTYTVVDVDSFASGIDVNAAAVSPTEYRFSAKGIETALQPLYTLAGLSTRPDYGELYIALTTTTGTTADGDVYINIQYTH